MKTEKPVPLETDAAARSLVDDVRALIDEGRALAEAEFAYQQSRAKIAGSGIRTVAGMGALGLALVFFALMGLTFALVLALVPLLTTWGAGGAVFFGFLLLAAVCMAIASARWKAIARKIADTRPEE